MFVRNLNPKDMATLKKSASTLAIQTPAKRNMWTKEEAIKRVISQSKLSIVPKLTKGIGA